MTEKEVTNRSKMYVVINTATRARRWVGSKYGADQLAGKWMNKTGNYCAALSHSEAVKYGWIR